MFAFIAGILVCIACLKYLSSLKPKEYVHPSENTELPPENETGFSFWIHSFLWEQGRYHAPSKMLCLYSADGWAQVFSNIDLKTAREFQKSENQHSFFHEKIAGKEFGAPILA